MKKNSGKIQDYFSMFQKHVCFCLPFSIFRADEAVCIGGATPSESYLRAELIIVAAKQTKADAIHPGKTIGSWQGRFF
jgi:biotin carboxylase